MAVVLLYMSQVEVSRIGFVGVDVAAVVVYVSAWVVAVAVIAE